MFLNFSRWWAADLCWLLGRVTGQPADAGFIHLHIWGTVDHVKSAIAQDIEKWRWGSLYTLGNGATALLFDLSLRAMP